MVAGLVIFIGVFALAMVLFIAVFNKIANVLNRTLFGRGQRMKKIVCSNRMCRHSNRNGATFCARCGQRLF